MGGTQQHDGAFGGLEDFFLGGVDVGVAADGGEVGSEAGKGLGIANFYLAETENGLVVGGVAGEVVAAHAADGEDAALAQNVPRQGERIRVGRSDSVNRNLAGLEGVAGAANGAADGLGVEASVGGVGVFGLAGVARGEGGHCGVGAIEGHGVKQRESGAAGGAVDEGVVVAAVGGIVEFREALAAGSEIGRDGGTGGGKGRGKIDNKMIFRPGGQDLLVDLVDAGGVGR